MSAAHFKLEQVLNYRCEIERVRKQEFATAKQAFDSATDRLSSEEQQVEDLAREFCHRQESLHSIDELRMYADFFARKREDIKQQKDTVDHLNSVMSERRNHLLDAAKDKKVLESLKERRAQEHKVHLAQKEQEFLNEIAIQKQVSSF